MNDTYDDLHSDTIRIVFVFMCFAFELCNIVIVSCLLRPTFWLVSFVMDVIDVIVYVQSTAPERISS